MVHASLPPGAAQPRVVIDELLCILNARVRRIFPLSQEELYFSIQDGLGHEVGILRSLDGLDTETLEIFRSELDRRYFSPVIQRIESLVLDVGMWRFDVRTQRGSSQFYVRNWRDSAHEISRNRWQIQSVDGVRYDIPDLEKLDARSQDLIDQVF